LKVISKDDDPSGRKRRQAVTIRKMEIDDLAPVFHLGEALFTARRVPNLYRTWDEFEVISQFQNDPDYCLVAEMAERLVGFLMGSILTKTRSAWKYGHLFWMGVEPACSRMGVADRLFRHFRDQMLKNGVRMLIVDTEADNEPALNFFKKMGFGSPQEHIYLSLNLTNHQRRTPRKRDNGNGRSNGKPA
jgi:ribosomal protein S18 acetylase RimI-like enzyme